MVWKHECLQRYYQSQKEDSNYSQGSAKDRVFPAQVDPARESGFRGGFRVQNFENAGPKYPSRVPRPVAEPWLQLFPTEI